jgi:PAS domain S-box-containing protein
MAQAKPISRRRSSVGEAKQDKLPRKEHALLPAQVQFAPSEKLWRSVFENSVIGVALTDLDGRFMTTNSAYQSMLGYTDEELQQLCFLDITAEEYREHNWALVEELLAGKRRQFQIEKQYWRKNRSLVWVRNNVSLVPDIEGMPRFIMALSEDITEFKHSEEARERAEEQVRRGEAFLLEGQRLSRTGTFSWKLATGEIRWSVELYRIFEFPPDLPVTLELIGSRVHPEDLPMMGEMIDSAKRGAGQFEYEHRIIMPDGSTKYIHLIGHAVRDAEGLVEYFGAAHDITQRRISEQALEASEQNLSMIINTIPAQAWSARPDGAAEFFNQRWLDYAGLTLKQAEGWGWKATIHPNDLDRMVSYWMTAMVTGEPVELEGRLRRFDGAYRWFLIRAEPFRDERGQIVRWYGTSSDIDDRKQAEEQLRRSEAFLAEGQRLSHTGTYSWRPDTNDITWSKELYRIFEVDPDTPVSMELTLTRIHPEDVPSIREVEARGQKSLTDYEHSFRILSRDGSTKYVHVMASATLDSDGRPEFLGAAQDITHHRIAEQALEASERNLSMIINTIPALAWSARPDGTAEFFNQRWLDYTGLSAEQSWGRGWMTAIHPADVGKIIDQLQSSLASGTAIEVEARICRVDGAYQWFLFRTDPLRNESGNVVRWYGTITDIDDRKRLEETLRANELSLRQIVDNIPGFVHTTSAMGEIEFISRQTLEFYGKTEEELKDWSRAGIVHPDDLPHTIEAWRKSIETGQDIEVEHRNRRFDGVYRWIQARGRAIRNGEGEITGWYWLLTDIEERKRAEEALRVNERNLRLIVDSIPGQLVRMSASGEVEFANRQLLAYFGKELEDIKNWSTGGIFHPEDLPRAIEIAGKSFASGEPYELEIRVRRFDGIYRWIQGRGIPLRDAEGGILNWYAIQTDIDDLKKAEEALQSSERNLSLIINTIPTLVWSALPDGSAEFFNQNYLAYVGLPLENLQGWGWAAVVHPQDQAVLSGAWQSIMAAGKTGEAEARLRRFDGQYRWFLFRANPMRDDSGQIVKWYGTNTDIHDRKQAEAEVKESYLRLAEAQQLSKTGSFITDLVADEHNWSEETFRIFEFDPAAKVTVQMIRDQIHPEDLPSFDAMIARAMTGMDVDFSFRFVTSGGAVKHIRGMARVIEHVVGRPLFIGALQDVTDSKVAEEALNKARSDLAHVSRVTTLNALTASIAHEINQPLTGIVANANTCLWLLSTDPPDIDGARETAQLTIRDGNRASDVIQRLRTLYGKKDSCSETMDLNEATREVISLSLSDLQRNRVIVRHELADDLPPVTGDRIQLQQVILNLIRNASDAMSKIDDRPRELLITTEREENNWVCVRVKDVGVGFQSKSADKLFEAFYTTKEHGMGIGLNVSRSIIEAHHGRLWATTNDGPGATLSFSIPCGLGNL